MTQAFLEEPYTRAASRGVPRESAVVTALIVALLIWLPLQTPIAVFVYQYLGVSEQGTRALLLAKDVVVAAAIVVLFLRHVRDIQLRWFDYLALLYVGTLLLYTLVPLAVGTELPIVAIIASLRVFALPVEMYALGRLAVLAGAAPRPIIVAFIVVSALAAAFTVLQYVFLPARFWETSLNLVAFIRNVQGLPNAISLWDISILGHYGVGNTGQFARAVGPFTHPVGTAHYFVLPLVVASATAFSWWRRDSPRDALLWALAALLFAAAVLTPISRGSWIAAYAAFFVCALVYRRLLAGAVILAVVTIFLLLVPPFSVSIQSAISRTDASVVGHQQAVEEGVETVQENPFGLGVGRADHFGNALGGGGGEGPGVGENMYLSLLVSTGPVGLVAFVGWMAGTGIALWHGRRGRGDALFVALVAVLIGYALSAMTASPLMRFTTSASFWTLIGLGVGLALASRLSEPKTADVPT